MKQLFCLFLLTLVTATSYAAVEKRYVSDQLRIQMRSGPSTEYRIVKSLPSGEHLTFIELSEDKNYTKVNARNVEGWVLTRFLVKQPIAREQLILVQRELEKVRTELDALKTQSNNLLEEKSTLSDDHSSLVREKNKLEKELNYIKEVSANALDLDKKNRVLNQNNQELEIQLETLSADNIRLKDDRERTFMIIGGGLIFFGIILGLAIPAMRSGRKSGGWS